MTPLSLFIILIGVLLNTAAQMLLKIGMLQIGYFEFSLANAFPIGSKMLTNLPILSGFTCYTLSVVLWLLVLSRTPVSIAYPMASLGYIFSTLAAYYFLGESISSIRLLGVIVILGGVYLIAQSH